MTTTRTEVITIPSSSPIVPISPKPFSMPQDPWHYSPPPKQPKTTFNPGSRAAAIPKGVNTGFQSASSLARPSFKSNEEFWHGAGLVDEVEDDLERSVKKKARKSSNEKAEPMLNEGAEPPKFDERKKSKAKPPEIDQALQHEAEPAPQEKKPRKRKDGGGGTNTQGQQAKAKAAKKMYGSAQIGRNASERVGTDKVVKDRHDEIQDMPIPDPPEVELKAFKYPKPLLSSTAKTSEQYPPAPKLTSERPLGKTEPERSWSDTPQAMSGASKLQSHEPSSAKQHLPICASNQALPNLQKRFAYGNDKEDGHAPKRQKLNDGPPALPSHASEAKEPRSSNVENPKETTKPKKQKSPVKQPKTITAIAIAQNQRLNELVPNGDNVHKQASNIKKKFESSKTAIEAPDPKPKPKSRSKKAAAKEPSKQRRLPSPKAAASRICRQDVIFATSSQIRQEDTQYLLDVEKAVEASEADAPHASLTVDEANPEPSDVQTFRLPRASRKLWTACTRSEENSLLAAEEVKKLDLGLIPDPSAEIQPIVAPTQAGLTDIDVSHDVSQLTQDPVSTAPKFLDNYRRSGLKLAPSKLRSKIPTSDTSAPSSLSTAMPLGSISPNKPTMSRQYSTVEKEKKKKKEKREKPAKPIKEQRLADKPAAATEEDAETTETAKPGPARKNAAKIAMPEADKAEEPSHVGEGEKAAETAKPKPARKKAAKTTQIQTDDGEAPPKRRPGRPRKDGSQPSTPTKKRRPVAKKKDKEAQHEWTAIEDIEDDVAPSPSPPRYKKKASDELEMSQDNTHDEPDQEPEDDGKAQERLFTNITSMVKSSPSPSDAALSWFEKIVLYDPVVLEDLTAWLNQQGIRLQDKEIKATTVQKWCESKSICCLWREGLRGGVKKRY